MEDNCALRRFERERYLWQRSIQCHHLNSFRGGWVIALVLHLINHGSPAIRAHTDNYQSGLGLGLYISRQIVELHEGTIGVEFPDDGGTRFVVRLPMRGPAGDPAR